MERGEELEHEQKNKKEADARPIKKRRSV